MEQTLLDDGQQMTPEQIQAQQIQVVQEQTETLTSDFSRFYSEEEFYQQFKSIFQYATDRTGIQSIAIKDSEERGARITASRIYEQAQKYAFLQFLIDKTTSRLAETILMLQFLSFKASDVYAEKTKRKLGGDIWQKVKKYIKKRKAQTDNVSESSEQVVPEKQQELAH